MRDILILGGQSTDYWWSYKILIFDLIRVEFNESKIKLPFKATCKAVTMENKNERDLLGHGFVRKY